MMEAVRHVLESFPPTPDPKTPRAIAIEELRRVALPPPSTRAAALDGLEGFAYGFAVATGIDVAKAWRFGQRCREYAERAFETPYDPDPLIARAQDGDR